MGIDFRTTPALPLALLAVGLAAACSTSGQPQQAAAGAPGTGGTLVTGAPNGTGGPGGTGGGATGGNAGPSPGMGGAGGAVPGAGGAGGTGGGGGAGAAGSASDAGATPAPDAGGSDAGAADAGQPSAPPGGYLLFPAPDAQGVCPDPPLRIRFSGPPQIGNAGKIQVFDAMAGAAAIAVVDLAKSSFSDTIGGTSFNLTRPAYVDGNDAVIYLPSHALGYGHSYYVTVDAGAVTGPTTTPFAVSGASSWRFTTAAAPPANLGSLSVALDGSGDFCSVQGALDALPANNTAPAVIELARGTYHEVIHLSHKNNVTLRGADRRATIIEGTNNNNLNPSTATRSLVGVDASSGLLIENMTIHNLTPQGGSQAEALRLQTCDQCVVRDADILSLQDTLLWSGRLYAKNCYIEGNVDFIWGTGAAYFDSCEIKTVVRSGYNVQARNAAGAYGYVFVDSKLTSDPGITGSTLGRIDASVYPGSQVAYVNCQMGSHISPAGWTITGGFASSSLRFWEYQSTDLSGNRLDTSQRIAGSSQINASQAAALRDPTMVLGGWQPPK